MAAIVPTTPRAPSPDAPTTDFALLEAQKENIRPLATGRSAAALGAYFEADDEARRVHEAKVEQFQRDIEEAERRDREGEDMVDGVQDVLDLWSRYVAFTVQHNPSSPSRIIPVVESASRRFIDDARYSQDMRYLKMWIIYQRHVERREEVWQFLESRDIGTRHAAFYEEWALVMEGLGRKKKADEVYRLGIARRAAPLERLKNRHAAFLTRILAASSDDIPEDDPTPPPQSNRRAVLGSVGGLPPSVAQSARGSRPNNGSKMEIFSDAAGRSEGPEATPWDDFGTRDGRRKENSVDAVPWKGEVMSQGSSRHRVAPRTPKLEVFQDSGAENGTAVTTADVIRAKGPANEAEMLRFDPLRNFDVGSVNPSLPLPTSLPQVAPALPTSARKAPGRENGKEKEREKERAERREKKRDKARFVMEPWSCPTGGAETRDAKGKIERRMFDWDAVFKGGEEWSFEEVRARQRGLLGRHHKPVADWERSWHPGGATSPKPVKKVARPPSPTVNTKLANAEVMSLFNQTIHGGKKRVDSDSDSDSDDDDEADDEPQALPTPLPRPRGVMSMMTPGGMVPPTPTPAPGRGGSPNIFENAPAGPAPRAGKMAIFAATPAKSPVFSDENAPASTAKMAVLSDENAVQDENTHRRPAETPARRPLGLSTRTPLAPTPSGAVNDENDPSATPAPGAPANRNIFALQDTIAEEDENSPARASVRNSPAPAQPQPSPHDHEAEAPAVPDEGYSYATAPRAGDYSYATAAGDDDNADAASENSNADYAEHYEAYTDEHARPFRNQMYNRHLLTPVTERTFEHTVTTAKSSRHASAFGRLDEEDEDEEDEEDEEDGEDAGAAERKSWRDSGSRSRVSGEASRRSSCRTDADADRSGLVDTGMFGVPEGYTIARKLEPDEAEKSTHKDSTTETGFDSSNAEFVTAPYGDTRHRSPKLEVFKDASIRASPKVEVLEDRSVKSLPKMQIFNDTRASPKMSIFADAASTSRAETPAVVPSPAKEPAPTPVPPTPAPSALPAVLSDIPNPCNPIDDSVVATLLERIEPPLEQQPLIRRMSAKSGRLAALQKHAKMHARRSSSASMRMSISPDEVYPLDLAGNVYEASHKIGEGGFGAVFMVVDKALQEALDEADEEDEDAAKLAIKVEKPANLWEAVLLGRVHERIPPSLASSVIKPRGLYAYADESFLLLDYCKQGTLLDVVNKASQWGIASLNGPAVPEEILAVFFTIELLRLVEGLHAEGFIHGDLKIDNCLVRLEPSDAWETQYTRTGASGWSSKGVRLIDFGRSADLSLFSAGDKQTFVADWKVDQRDCVAMREGHPWSFEADYFGLASVCYCLLHGKYIGTETVETPEGKRHKLDAPMKRYWQAELWAKLFDTLLNPHAIGELPITSSLAAIRGEFESWLEDNCAKNGRNLRQLLKRIEIRSVEGRP